MKARTDEILLDHYFSGDAGAFQEFYRRHYSRVVGFAKSKGLTTEAAEEVAQESFLRLHKSIEQYDSGRPALPWLFSIVQNCVIDSLRASLRLNQLRSELHREGNDQLSSDSETPQLEVGEALKSLPIEQQRIVQMRVLEDLSFKEISSVLDKKEVNLRKAFERAKEKMTRFLKGGDTK